MVRALWVAQIPLASVLGFLVMFLGVVLAVMGGRGPAGGKGAKDGASRAKSSFTQRMEERFRQRFEDQ